uniref:UNC93-like protein MFSD11 n=1 Tax=Plectus sambesii TaxID=2011161 RepID=A0A914XGC5_9BILA
MFGIATFAYLLAPPIVIALGAKWSITIGGVTYLIFMASFFYIRAWLLYLTSAILGFGAVLFWTAQGNYLTMNSDKSTASRNSGVMWAIFQLSSIVGGLCLFFVFKFTVKSGTTIQASTIRYLYAAFSVLCALGVIALGLLRRPPNTNSVEKEQFEPTSEQQVARSQGHVENLFGKVILAYNALCFGFGQIVGGSAFGIFGKKFDKYGRTPIIIFAAIAHLACFALIFVNLPTQAPIEKTNDTSLIEPSLALALVCSFLLGLADSCWNTQIYSILATIYSDRSTQGFAIYKFCNAAMVGISFYFYGSYLQLRIQLLIMAIGAVIATGCFYAVESSANRRAEVESSSEDSEAPTVRSDSISIQSIGKKMKY